MSEKPGLLARLFRTLFILAFGFILGVVACVYASIYHKNEVNRVMGAVSALPLPAPAAGSSAPATVASAPPAASGRAQVRLIDFGAEWCGPCKIQDPIIESLAASYSGRITVTKIDVDQNPQLADRYSVQAVPTLIIERDGQIAGRFMGLQEEAVLAKALEDALR